MRRGYFDQGCERLGYRGSLEPSIRMMSDADYRQKTCRDQLRISPIFGYFVEAKSVGEHSRSLFFDQNVNLKEVLKTEGLLIIALGMNPGKAKRRIKPVETDGKPQRPVEAVLGRFHIPEKIREMDNASHVRFRKLHTSYRFELEGHIRRPVVGIPDDLTTPARL